MINGQLVIQNRKKVDVIQLLKTKKYAMFSKEKKGDTEADHEEENEEETSSNGALGWLND